MKKVFSLATVAIMVFALSACRGPWGWHGGHREHSSKGKYNIHHNGKSGYDHHGGKGNHGSKGGKSRMKMKEGHGGH